eukprot:scaffold4065_cov161-Skeletonema_dohrnii-CCMP3373.AAC.5
MTDAPIKPTKRICVRHVTEVKRCSNEVCSWTPAYGVIKEVSAYGAKNKVSSFEGCTIIPNEEEFASIKHIAIFGRVNCIRFIMQIRIDETAATQDRSRHPPLVALKAAICGVAKQRYHEEGDYKGAFEYYTKAAGLGDARRIMNYRFCISEGKAAIGGHPRSARLNLAANEFENGRFDRAVKHWMIGAKLGHVGSMKAIEQGFRREMIRKEDYAMALRAHQVDIDATKSPQMEEAEARYRLMMMNQNKPL